MTQKWVVKYERKPGRWVFEPTPEFRVKGEEIRQAVADAWKPPKYYYHLRAGGHVSALRQHTHHTYFARFDIDDFFGRIGRTRVTRCLKEYFGYLNARQMATDSTVRHPTQPAQWVLPYGFVQSPILASLALAKSRLGHILDELHATSSVVVTVYVDDLIMSSDSNEQLTDARAKLFEAAAKSRLPFNPGKSVGPGTTITAFNVNLTRDHLAIVDERLTELTINFAAAVSEHQRSGIVGYVRSINSDQADSLVGT